ncbi:hypothetical protein HPB50_016158 [Hyalomma asiaticum]|uniref:Uncharacterized protein n=1 Tax=Hyalomma asiaticum TaxID=266040 RepID=A0ACB7SN86_HYAAI|nr:hypothetical protein HPB50_016158 [Hyalomma asiaticum]
MGPKRNLEAGRADNANVRILTQGDNVYYEKNEDEAWISSSAQRDHKIKEKDHLGHQEDGEDTTTPGEDGGGRRWFRAPPRPPRVKVFAATAAASRPAAGYVFLPDSTRRRPTHDTIASSDDDHQATAAAAQPPLILTSALTGLRKHEQPRRSRRGSHALDHARMLSRPPRLLSEAGRGMGRGKGSWSRECGSLSPLRGPIFGPPLARLRGIEVRPPTTEVVDPAPRAPVTTRNRCGCAAGGAARLRRCRSLLLSAKKTACPPSPHIS